MKTIQSFLVSMLLMFATFCGCEETYLKQNGKIDLSKQKKLYYGVKINDVLCGYSEIDIESVEREGQKVLRLQDHTFAMTSALGSSFNSDMHSLYYVDSLSGQVIYQKHDIQQGPLEIKSEATAIGDTLFLDSNLAGKKDTVIMGADVLLRNSQFFPFLVKDFADRSIDEKTYTYFEIRDQEIQQTTYKRVGEEGVILAGVPFKALVFEEMNENTGQKMKWWIDKENGHLLKLQHPRGDNYLTDAGVKNRIKKSNMDDLIVQKTNVSIGDFQGITYMKVKARLEPSGLRVTPGGLNVQGQKFTGTVTENLIDGIFEIEHKHYDGVDAHPFPPDFSQVDSVQEFIKPTDVLESDDPVLIEKAASITAGSKNAWEAAVRLSQWVADSIGYAIPGGLTARNTYDIRKGECGAHSILLAAFCRTVGIPARMVWGCMYIPNRGGAFGQHGWTEVYMGNAGWIPVDATAKEVDYVDSGHLRVGHWQSISTALHPKEMEILDYRVGNGSPDHSTDESKYQQYIGRYKGALELDVLVQNGNLTIDIPGRMILALNDQDENGYWYAKASNAVFIEFLRKEDETTSALILHEIISLPKLAEADSADFYATAENLTPYVGIYDFQQANAEFRVFDKEGVLAIHNPLENRDVKVQAPDSRGRWKDEFDKNEIFFEDDNNGKIIAMKIDSRNLFQREN